MMKITVLTTFKDFYTSFLESSIIARAISKKLVEINIVNLRDYTLDKHHRTDSNVVGGGAGMVLKPQPIFDCLKKFSTDKTLKIVLTPRGTTFNQDLAYKIVKEYDDILILCGHYEGIDERIYKYFDLELSLGDFITTGGEVVSLVLIDSLTRLVDGVINSESLKDESFNDCILEYPQYTLPYDFENDKIPDILFSGNHQAIKKYNRKMALKLTKEKRPDLFNKLELTKEDIKLLQELESNETPKWEKDAISKGEKFLKDKK